MSNTQSNTLLQFNGINGATGEYGLPPMSSEQLARLIRGEGPPDNLDDLRLRRLLDDFSPDAVNHLEDERARLQAGLSAASGLTRRRQMQDIITQIDREITRRSTKELIEGIDPARLDRAGWGILFPYGADPAIKEALGELLDWRRQQAGELFRVFEGPQGYRPGESKADFLLRLGAAAAGPADPAAMPYYLLIAASPWQIPYTFQYQLDVQYAVGRIYFDTPQEYANYARTVIMAEKGQFTPRRRMSFFGTANPDDPVTRQSADALVTPLHAKLTASATGWSTELILREQATKAQLASLLGGAGEAPGLLFTASHGMEFPAGDARQLPHQGALLCQDWPGPQWWKGPIPQDHYVAGDDLRSDANLNGMMAFFFACYGAGTPALDEFAQGQLQPRAIAPHSFMARLPAKMLGLPRGGALAVVGHVERVWGYSFAWPGARSAQQTAVFQSSFERLLKGLPVGHAMEFFNERYAELSSALSDGIGSQLDPSTLSAMWTANNDARGYIIIGDPAARLPTAAATPAQASHTINLASRSSNGKPEGISDEDWRNTPGAVKEYIQTLRSQ